jgi:hypothetical protein
MVDSLVKLANEVHSTTNAQRVRSAMDGLSDESVQHALEQAVKLSQKYGSDGAYNLFSNPLDNYDKIRLDIDKLHVGSEDSHGDRVQVLDPKLLVKLKAVSESFISVIEELHDGANLIKQLLKLFDFFEHYHRNIETRDHEDADVHKALIKAIFKKLGLDL